MMILITALILALTAVILLILRVLRPNFRFFWLGAVGGTLAAWALTWLWLLALPMKVDLPAWQPTSLFSEPVSFVADGISWPFALSLVTVALAVLLTEIARSELTNPLPWAGLLTLTGLGMLAVTANNPLTLLLIWAALDMAELITLLRAVDDPAASERAVIGFSTRVIGTGLMLWAHVVSIASGSRLGFQAMPTQAGLFLLLAAGLRLGVLPLHLPFSSDSLSRRGVGTSLRLISAASSLILLARVAPGSTNSAIISILLVLVAITVVYAGWTWLRAPDDLAGRAFWVIGMAGLALAAALRANAVGAAAWGCALVLAGGALFLVSIQNPWLNRALMVGAFGLTALPFSLTASGWESKTGTFFLAWPLLVTGQALLVAGFVRHSLRPGSRETLEGQPIWARNVYPAGIAVLLLTSLALGFLGWDGALRLGTWVPALLATILAIMLVWLTPRLRILNPIRAHWVRPASRPWLGYFAQGFWNTYHAVRRLSDTITGVLEGEGSIMWTLLFLALFISLMSRGTP
jgi:hypothetical protein